MAGASGGRPSAERLAPRQLLVVHTAPEADDTGDEPRGRIISARKASAKERRAYEETGL